MVVLLVAVSEELGLNLKALKMRCRHLLVISNICSKEESIRLSFFLYLDCC